jgi:predicted nuclease of predicted toxin-antitoxin system
MKILVDMNLAVRWADMLVSRGIDAVHWSVIGAANAPDIEIMAYAQNNGYAVFTNDLDFSAILAATYTSKPSVIQIRAEDTRPEGLLDRVANTFIQMSSEIEQGGLITIAPHKTRLHILPFSHT